jgi:hypothetical protein
MDRRNYSEWNALNYMWPMGSHSLKISQSRQMVKCGLDQFQSDSQNYMWPILADINMSEWVSQELSPS